MSTPSKKDTQPVNNKLRIGLLLLLIFGVGGSITFTGIVANDLPPLNEIENPRLDLSTQIYTADGQLLGSFFDTENRIYAPLDKISPHVIKALIATEDVRFYNHNGIDPMSFPAILWYFAKNGRFRGGSTLTMQLTRNLYRKVGKKRDFTRKLKEMIVSAIIERKFTKDEILEGYLNTAAFYGNKYGIEMASRSLFGKRAKDLDLHEAALCVGILKGPTFYSPTGHPDRALSRRNIVLDQMVKYKMLDSGLADSLKAMPLGLNHSKVASGESTATYFKEHVKSWLNGWCKEKGRDIDPFTAGLKVYTTIDSRMQNYAEEAVEEHLAAYQQTFESELKRRGYPWVKNKKILEDAVTKTERYRKAKANGMPQKDINASFKQKQKMRIWTWSGWQDSTMTPMDSTIHYLKFLETGFMAMDPGNGHIKAWVGGINYSAFQYDHVSQAKRQVGSTFKPFVYAAALDRGIMTPCKTVLDMPVTIELPNGKTWSPKNSGGKDKGLINYNIALANSINQVTASLMMKVGPENVCEYAHNIGIDSELDCVPSLCLGTSSLNLKEMVRSYCTFANGGFKHEPQFITRIEDRYGNIIEQFSSEAEAVLAAETAYTVVSMLQNVVDDLTGTAHSLRSKYKFSNQIGGKTGTTQDHTDGWFMGVTPQLVAGAWVGCSDNRVRFPTIRYGQGAKMALPIYGIFMQKVYADRELKMPKDPFERPENYTIELNCPPPVKQGAPGGDDDGFWNR